jgi:serine/threonine protein kinase
MDLEKIGKYKIVGKLGQGAMGEVFKAQDLVLKRFVALKTISPTLLADEQFRKRFRREAESAAQLNHPNIVTVFEFNELQGQIFLVMELLEGRDLKEMIVRQGLNRLEDKLLVMEQICEGLAYAHSKGVIHRDLKPANIRVLPNLAVKILDFGLARLGVSEMTRTGTVMGTPNYMSPEQVRGEKVDERSDLFSVGAVFYELLSGHKPFDSESVHSILYEVLEHDPQPLRSWVPDLPPLLLPIVDRALAKDPEGRFASAGQMREAVRAARRAIAAGKAAAELLQPGMDSEATIVGRDSPTIAELDSSGASLTSIERPMVAGATALDLSSTSMDRSLPRTARPEPTLYPKHSGWRGMLVALLSLFVVVGLGLVVWSRLFAPAAPSVPPADLAKEQEGILREQLVASQVELARTYLDNRDYAEAASQAERVLSLAPDSADARQLLDRARQTLADLDKSAKEASAAFERGDTEAATRALGRVLAIDPRHPVAGQLTTALNTQFRRQAEEASRAASRSRQEAEKARAGGQDLFRAADRATREAQDLLGKEQFAQATQKFMEAGDGFDRARRATEVAAAAAAAAAAQAAAQQAAAARATAAPTYVPAPPTTAPVAVAQMPFPAPPIAAPSLPAPSTSRAPALAPEAAIRRAIADYGRAIETKDIALYKSVRPGITADEEKRLRDSFKAIQSQRVSLTVDALQIDGSSATARVSRQDTVNGKAMPSMQRTIRLVLRDGVWTIQSTGSQ